jgi:hypothetical protein
MAKLTDPEILLCYRNALRNWRYEGFVVFEKDAAEGLRKHLDGVTPKGFKEILHQFVVVEGGEVDQVTEERENWRYKWSHHYDIRLVIGGVKFYVESRLHYSNPADRDDPVIYLVHIKPA